MIAITAAFVSFIIVFAGVPVLRRMALRIGFVDRPSPRKIHRKPVPLMGGAAIYAAVTVTFILYQGITGLSLTVAVGGLALVAIGLTDDAFKAKGRDFPVWPRVVGYLAVSMLPLSFGIRIMAVTDPVSGKFYLFPEWLSAVATIVWVFALINMVNFIDGADGLASGVSMISSATLLVAAIIKKQPDTALLAAIIIGACIGFLAYNFHPARIFLGDAGATFLGFVLAVVAVEGAFKSATLLSMAVPILALGLPIFDTIIVMLRRLLSGKPLHRADNMHFHHVLMRWGLNQVQAVSFLYLIAALFALLSIVLLLVQK